jgi:hypothetical protein
MGGAYSDHCRGGSRSRILDDVEACKAFMLRNETRTAIRGTPFTMLPHTSVCEPGAMPGIKAAPSLRGAEGPAPLRFN